VIVLTHISGALFHTFIRRDNVINRMLPRVMGGY
jgi:cytochrome b561